MEHYVSTPNGDACMSFDRLLDVLIVASVQITMWPLETREHKLTERRPSPELHVR
jgi:hypothetical protein